MREDFIQEEIKKGNTDVRSKIGRIEMIQPPTEGDALSSIDKRKDRSLSKSRSPEPHRATPILRSPERSSIAPY